MSTGMSAFRSSVRETRGFVTEILMAGLVPFVRSSPGMGKSAIIKAIAEEYSMVLIDIRLSTCAPEDLTGLPFFDNGIAKFMPFDMFPIEGTPIPPGKNGWIIFLDEFNSAPKSVQAAAYKLVLDKMVGTNKLHPQVMIVAAGNLDTDRAITNNIGTALQSRFIHLEMFLKTDSMGQQAEFLEDVAFKYDWDKRVVAYIGMNPGALMDFRPDHNDKTFCCPRTWDFCQALIKGKEFTFVQNGQDQVYEMDAKAPMIAGTITSGEAMKFINFTKVYQNLPKINDIMRDPDGAPVPSDPPVRYATVTMLMELTTEDTFQKITQYLNRMTSELRVLYFRGLMIKKPQLRSHPAFRSAMLELSRYLHD